ncbi:hypothetical protein CATRI_00075 [Corynebacterium atrinae]|uniref:helix-turn-helix transcriptional regulator n=1 Tax=Corynebacterium atrinae TaxID=1336740 RepID=UPI0025B2C644|nr:DNA-binding protein [Corynebacterium atrinae]WJY62138.1 hypothetical protein CATRI_00075 [Corynebacterium atrinae]
MAELQPKQDFTLIPAKMTAQHLGVSTQALAKMRMNGTGPAFIKIGARVLYHPDDITAYVDANRRTHTTPEVA